MAKLLLCYVLLYQTYSIHYIKGDVILSFRLILIFDVIPLSRSFII